MKFRHKKAVITMDQLVPIILAIVIAGMVMGAGGLVLSKFADKIQTTTDYTVTGESMILSALPNATAAQSNATFVKIATVTVYNQSIVDAFILINAANYTVDATGGTINLTTISSYTELNASINYTYTLDDNPTEFLATKNSSQGVLEIASFMPTIGIILAVVIIVGLVLLVGRKKTM